MKLQNKVAIITGGANGIGWEAVNVFLKAGAKVAIADYSIDGVKEKITELGEYANHVAAFHVNVANRDSVNEMVQAVDEHFGKIDILINNAGITKDAMLTKMSIEDFQSVIDVNLTGLFHCTQAVVPHLIQNQSGRIINTSSVSGVYGNVGQTNYAAAKSGIIGMTKTWAKELGRKGITVNAVVPGFIATSMVETIPEKVIDKLKSTIPLQRLGKPADIANAYLYLASDEANYVNGTVLHVDGGIMM
ncbi:3-oxoacyl-ACP reductase FabG [Bacillus massiliigorillae]|uniref:3-oxoacyl-ACP reductase FabG n=1 Tax=Bacillus massiliigorillae TaxID=1243664 RepID=UPI000399ECE8|nr:3-oxoacyl-ACP reductase FabG [Bacillus massiliigorillae]